MGMTHEMHNDQVPISHHDVIDEVMPKGETASHRMVSQHDDLNKLLQVIQQ